MSKKLPTVSVDTLHRPLSLLREHTESGYVDGYVVTQHGIVGVYIQGNSKDFHLSKFQFICGGRMVSVSFPRRFSIRRAVTIAKRLTGSYAVDRGHWWDIDADGLPM